MRSSTDTTTKTMLVLALLAALAVLLRLGENLLPLPVQLGVLSQDQTLIKSFSRSRINWLILTIH